MKAKTRKKIAIETPGAPLPQYFHPKDDPRGSGTIIRIAGVGVHHDSIRQTVMLCAGGAVAEMTPEAAERIVADLQCAISCARRVKSEA